MSQQTRPKVLKRKRLLVPVIAAALAVAYALAGFLLAPWIAERGAKRIETAPDFIVEEVLQRPNRLAPNNLRPVGQAGAPLKFVLSPDA